MANFAEELKKAGFRIALYPELKQQRYTLVCGVCNDATEIQPTNALPSHCASCGLSLSKAAPRFWVLLPKSVPPPEDE